MNTWSEQVDQIRDRVSITKRARQRLAAMVNVEGMSIAAAAAEFGVICHSDAGGQYVSIAHTDRLDDIGAAPSIGTVGDSYDCDDPGVLLRSA